MVKKQSKIEYKTIENLVTKEANRNRKKSYLDLIEITVGKKKILTKICYFEGENVQKMLRKIIKKK